VDLSAASLGASFVGGVAAAVLVAAMLTASALAAWRLTPRAPASVRAAAAAVVALWLQAALFWVLAPAGAFRLAVALPLWVLLAALALRAWGGDPAARAALAGDLAGLRRLIGSPPRPSDPSLDSSGGLPGGAERPRPLAASRSPGLWRRWSAWPLGAVAGVAFVSLLRGLAAPPLGWDALTYHLFKAGRWVQQGGLAPWPAPDAWSYYEYYSPVGDVVWGWSFLPLRGDALLAPAGTLLWLLAGLGIYACARLLGAARVPAALAGAAAGAVPSSLAYLASGYVDNATLALFALASVFVLRLAAGGPLREAPLAAAALGMMVGVKLTTAPILLLGGAVIVARLLRGGRGDVRPDDRDAARGGERDGAERRGRAADGPPRRPVRRAAAVAGLCLAAAAPGAPGYLRAWAERGSPFYPFALSVGGVTLSRGNEEANVVGSGSTLGERQRLGSPWDAAAYLLYRPTREGAFVAPGPGGALLLLLGLAGGLRALAASPGRARSPRWVAAPGEAGRRERSGPEAPARAPLRAGSGDPPSELGSARLGPLGSRPGEAADVRRRPPRGITGGRPAVVYLLLAAAAILGILLAPGGELARGSVKIATAGRYLMPGLGALAMLAATLPGRIALPGLAAAALLGVAFAWPRGWVAAELPAVALVLAAALPAAGAVAWVARRPRSLAAIRSPALRAAGALALAGLAAVVLVETRRAYRYPLWAAAARPRAPLYHMHRLHPAYAAAWSAWSFLDDGAPHRVAATAGWDGLGHNWYLYPLLGGRLQNEVLYVPVAADGAVVDYRLGAEVARRASFPAWVGRLVAAEVEYVASLAPRSTVEERWMAAAPALFTPAAGDPNGLHVVYRFNRREVLERLRAAAPAPGPAPPPAPTPPPPG
jgi:hypothetical protein